MGSIAVYLLPPLTHVRPLVPTAVLVLRATREVPIPANCMCVVRGILVLLSVRFVLLVIALVLR